MARRFFRHIGDERQSASNPTITIATAGVAVGLAVMIVTVCVIMGFKREVMSKVRGFASDIEVLDLRSLSSPESFPITADDNYIAELKKIPDVKKVSRIAQKMGMLKTSDSFQGITLKGLPADYDTTFIASAIIEGRMPRLLNHNTNDVQASRMTNGSNEILISQRQADDLGLKVGDRVYTYFFEETIRMRRFKICGIYNTNMGIFDKNVVVSDFQTVARLNKWKEDQCSSLEIQLTSLDRLPEAMPLMNAYHGTHPDPMAVPRKPLSVKDHYIQVFSWLNLLDTNMMVIILLMVAVAGFTMVSGLLILILERIQTIGILKALGATNTTIRRIFLYFASFITLRGLIIGDAIALLLLVAQKHWGFVHLDPSSYYVETVPIELNALAIVSLNVATLAITTLALVAPSFMISRVQPAKAIRYE